MSDKWEDQAQTAAARPADAEPGGVSADPPTSGLAPLVIVPLLLAGVFAGVVGLFGWLAVGGDRPADLVARLQRADRGSFRAAVSLLQMLRDPANETLRKDRHLAAQLADLLQGELEAGPIGPQQVQLRCFLCRALGEFSGDDALPTLISAARTERDPREIEVRRSALEAIAQIASRRLTRGESPDPSALQAALEATQQPAAEEAAAAPRDSLRASAAFTLGVLGGDAALARLVHLLEDAHADVRFNAATGLARHGRAEAETVLLEMLDPDSPATAAGESTARGAQWRRQIVLGNALRSVESLVAANPQMDATRLRERVRRLSDGAEDPLVRHQARRTLQALAALPPPGSDSND